MTWTLKSIAGILLGLTLAVAASAQSSTEQSASGVQNSGKTQKEQPGVGSEMGRGAGDIGSGAAKGAGAAAKGTAAAAGDLVTLHPIKAGASVGTSDGENEIARPHCTGILVCFSAQVPSSKCRGAQYRPIPVSLSSP
jgi:hypothetical protein